MSGINWFRRLLGAGHSSRSSPAWPANPKRTEGVSAARPMRNSRSRLLVRLLSVAGLMLPSSVGDGVCTVSREILTGLHSSTHAGTLPVDETY